MSVRRGGGDRSDVHGIAWAGDGQYFSHFEVRKREENLPPMLLV